MAEKANKKTKLHYYPVEEKYGFVWVHPDSEVKEGVYQIPELAGKKILHSSISPFRRVAHPHITMMNSIDEQHMRTVHKFDVKLDVEIKEQKNKFEVHFHGKNLKTNWAGKLQNFLFGDRSHSSVLFIDGCVGVLTMFIGMKLFKRFKMPKTYFLFSQGFTKRGKTVVHPIVITEKRKGIIGFLFSHLLIQLNRFAIWFLAWQDGRIIYGNLRFSQAGILPNADRASLRWIAHINKNLVPSIWSKKLNTKHDSNGETDLMVTMVNNEQTESTIDSPLTQ